VPQMPQARHAQQHLIGLRFRRRKIDHGELRGSGEEVGLSRWGLRAKTWGRRRARRGSRVPGCRDRRSGPGPPAACRDEAPRRRLPAFSPPVVRVLQDEIELRRIGRASPRGPHVRSGRGRHPAADTRSIRCDRISEEAALEWLEQHWPRERAAGSWRRAGPAHGPERTVPRGTPVAATRLVRIIDPIDGTRGLMYDKRSAWILAAVAPAAGREDVATGHRGRGDDRGADVQAGPSRPVQRGPG
jgi:hypothetical protein